MIGGEDRPPFEVPSIRSIPQVEVDRDGTTWSIVGSELVSVNAGGEAGPSLRLRQRRRPALARRQCTVARRPGSRPSPARARRVVGRARASYGRSRRVAASELVVQAPGPSGRCGWVAQGDHLWCVDDERRRAHPLVPGLQLGSRDRFAVAGDVVVVVDSNSGELQPVRLDGRASRSPTTTPSEVPPDVEVLELSVTADAVWIDDVFGDDVWVAHPWGFTHGGEERPECARAGRRR